jgi:putative redox protein
MGSQQIRWVPDEGVPMFEGIDDWRHPIRIGGDRDGDSAKPSDLVPLSLAACTAHEVIVILRKQRQQIRGVEVAIETEQDPDPPWMFRRILMHFVITGPVDPAKARKAIELTERKYCAVAATLGPVVEMGSTLEVRPAPA